MRNTGGKSLLSRRAFVGKVAAVSAGAAGAAVAWSATTGRAGAMTVLGDTPTTPAVDGQTGAMPDAARMEPVTAVTPPSPPPPWELISPLALGASVGHGWRVAGLTGVEDGSCVVTLENERGRAHRVHLCRNDGTPQGLVYTKHLDLVVMNGGQGDLPTEEGLAQAVAQLAHVLAANEGNGRHAQVMSGLLPQGERLEKYASAARLR
jgi:hypothetical protein